MITLRSPWFPFFAALVIFLRASQGVFHLDDYAILVDPAITSPNGWLDCFRWTQTRPLTWLSFWANYQMFGEWAGGYLAMNLLLHATNSALLRIAMANVMPVDVAAGAALLFAVHPFAVEPVNYVFARAILLATLFSLLAMHAWFKEKFWHALGWFTLGMLAKEECAALPIFFLMYEWSIRITKKRLVPIAAMFGVASVLGARTILATKVIAGSGSGFGAAQTPLQYFSKQGEVIQLKYFFAFIHPSILTIDPEPYSLPGISSLVPWITILLIIGLASRSFRNLGTGFWFICGLVLLLPSSSILPAADLAAFRRMYLPMVAISVAFASAFINSNQWFRLAAILYFAAHSFWQTSFWLTEVSLWTRAVEISHNKIRPRIHLARVSPNDKALEILNDLPKSVPGTGTVASEKARVYLSMHKPELALAEFGKALALSPSDPLAISNRGAVLGMLGQKEAAKSDFVRALQLDPCQYDARYNLKLLGFPIEPPPTQCRWNQNQKRQFGLVQ